MALMNLTARVRFEIESLKKREFLASLNDIATKIANRLTHGWSFTGQSAEDHNDEVRQIKFEVIRQLETLRGQ